MHPMLNIAVKAARRAGNIINRASRNLDIVRRFFPDGDDVEIAAGAVDDIAGTARGLDGDVEHRMHKICDE